MATPISLVTITTVISLSGLGSGAANLGITACCYTFIVGDTVAYVTGVQETPMSAGFGYTGLVRLLNALKYMDSSALVNVLKLLAAHVLVLLPGFNNEIFKFNNDDKKYSVIYRIFFIFCIV